MPDITRNPFSRRHLLTGAGRTLSLAAVSLIVGSKMKTASAADVSQDVKILNAAISLEHEGIAAYQIAATSGLLQPAVVEIGVAFQGHHKGHRDLLVKAVETLGGKPSAEKSLDEYAKDLNAASLKNQTDVLRLALGLERGAANAYLGLIPSLGPDFHQVAAQMAGDEAFHAAILANALGEPIPKDALIFG
ncbi:ferritin-like domain-containing protein [Sneathiella chungangensis]|uniref:Ferritin-like domain-containing protein n=1 Tax=Sneathiella chungangensis TaxID=1418234 RepID=A0A845MHP9_9PROT|nr:ferritin-like domain-containing protein [Sneathiella chungangensis]MZR22787.1 ferritin-like domain-containing protein [Sneathiella chungangensis]